MLSSGRAKRIRFQDEEEVEEGDAEDGPTRLQTKMLAMAGQDINEFLQEVCCFCRFSRQSDSILGVIGRIQM